MNTELSKELKKVINETLNAIEEEVSVYNSNKVALTSSSLTSDFFKLRLANKRKEHFEVAFLNAQHKLIKCVRMFSGTIDRSAVYPREVAKKALQLDAVAVILAHNHPSGSLCASQADLIITNKIVQCLAHFDIKVLDHVIVCSGTVSYSFAENNQL